MSMNAMASESSWQTDTSAAPWIRSQKVQWDGWAPRARFAMTLTNAEKVPNRAVFECPDSSAETLGDEPLVAAPHTPVSNVAAIGSGGACTARAHRGARAAFAEARARNRYSLRGSHCCRARIRLRYSGDCRDHGSCPYWSH